MVGGASPANGWRRPDRCVVSTASGGRRLFDRSGSYQSDDRTTVLSSIRRESLCAERKNWFTLYGDRWGLAQYQRAICDVSSVPGNPRSSVNSTGSGLSNTRRRLRPYAGVVTRLNIFTGKRLP